MMELLETYPVAYILIGTTIGSVIVAVIETFIIAAMKKQTEKTVKSKLMIIGFEVINILFKVFLIALFVVGLFKFTGFLNKGLLIAPFIIHMLFQKQFRAIVFGESLAYEKDTDIITMLLDIIKKISAFKNAKKK